MSPQIEDGYIKIANELVDALIKANLSGQEFRAALFVIRKTYGYNKKDDYIALTQFQAALGISKIRASQIVISLQNVGVLTVKENINGLTKKYRFNKHHHEWNTVKEKRYRKGKTIEPYRKTFTTKDNTTKDNVITIKSNNIGGTKKEKFTPPTIMEVRTYCQERGNGIDPEQWHDFYQAKDWMIGKNKMKDWKAAVRTWERGGRRNGESRQSGKPRRETNEDRAARYIREAYEELNHQGGDM